MNSNKKLMSIIVILIVSIIVLLTSIKFMKFNNKANVSENITRDKNIDKSTSFMMGGSSSSFDLGGLFYVEGTRELLEIKTLKSGDFEFKINFTKINNDVEFILKLPNGEENIIFSSKNNINVSAVHFGKGINKLILKSQGKGYAYADMVLFFEGDNEIIEYIKRLEETSYDDSGIIRFSEEFETK